MGCRGIRSGICVNRHEITAARQTTGPHQEWTDLESMKVNGDGFILRFRDGPTMSASAFAENSLSFSGFLKRHIQPEFLQEREPD